MIVGYWARALVQIGLAVAVVVVEESAAVRVVLKDCYFLGVVGDAVLHALRVVFALRCVFELARPAFVFYCEVLSSGLVAEAGLAVEAGLVVVDAPVYLDQHLAHAVYGFGFRIETIGFQVVTW